MSVSQSFFKTTNYLVPSNGQTHAVVFKGAFSANAFLVDWRQFAIDNEKFQPQGAFVDNTAGTVPLVVTIQPINYSFSVGAGLTAQVQFPAPNGQTCTITGDPNNSATVVFVDFPVLPSGVSATITNTPNVNIASIGTTVMNANDNPMAANNTLPYRTQEYVAAAEALQGSIAAGATTVTVTPAAANKNLRRLVVSISGDGTLAVAGEVTVTIALNAATILRKVIYVPATTPANSPLLDDIINFNADTFGLNAGAGGLSVTLSSALATGVVNVNAYFTPQ